MKLYIFSGDCLEDGVAVVMADNAEEARVMLVESKRSTECPETFMSSSREWWRVEELPLEKGCAWAGGEA